MSSLPRVDQITDFLRNRSVQVLGSASPIGGAGRAVAERAGGRAGRTFTRSAQAFAELEGGHQIPWDDLLPLLTELLALADNALARGRHQQSVTWTNLAILLAYHRSTHYGPLHSPLALRTDEFLAPFRDSAAGRAMLLEADPAPAPTGGTPPRSRGDGQPLRVLILCHSSWTFIRRVEEDLHEHAGIEFRTVDVSQLPLAERPTHGLVMRQRSTWNRSGRLHPVPAALEEPLAWADTVFVEWGVQPFAWFSFLDLSAHQVRTVARIHRFECLTPYPLLARGGAYDAIGFVSPPLRTMLEAVSPRIRQAPQRPTFHNVHSLEAFAPAEDRRRFELVQIGWAVPTKDVALSLEMLRRLRAEDPRYVLRLVGPTLEQTAIASTASWAQDIAAQIEELGEGVMVDGYRSDVPELLARTGFILSSSVSEGTHESVAEAAAAGCVPVVRNWPEIAPWGGAEMVYPADWIIEDVESAVDRIRSLSTPGAFDAEAERARTWIQSSRQPDAIRADYLSFLQG